MAKTKTLLTELQNATKHYLDVRVYDQEAWAGRGETIGRGSVLTLVAEGTLNHILNGHFRPTNFDLSNKKLDKLANKYGCYVEQGFSWSWHFYPHPGADKTKWRT